MSCKHMESISRGPSLSSHWDVLGPFQIGTREAAWGADPLEAVGGFVHLPVDRKARFPSSLGEAGTVTWRSVAACADGKHLTFEFLEAQSQQAVSGWTALQYQAWARGSIQTHEKQKFLLHVNGLLEFWLDDEHVFGGDFYGLGQAPLVIDLRPGTHLLNLRILRDVRCMGTNQRAPVELGMSFHPIPEVRHLTTANAIVPDVFDGRLAGDLASVVATNVTGEVVQIERASSNSEAQIELYSKPLILYPGQSRPIALSVLLLHGEVHQLTFTIYTSTASSQSSETRVTIPLQHRASGEVHKITYMHPSSVVSYSMLRPPLQTSSQDSVPILVFLHGSGIGADNPAVSSMLSSINDVDHWTLFPSGVTTWCGDDWHDVGWADVDAALRFVSRHWNRVVDWKGPSVYGSQIIIAGHSNGGQGVYYALAHFPDRIAAAVCASAYSSIQAYVPFFWRSESEPAVNAIISSTLSSYRHELLVPSRCVGIPVAVQHGSADDNVPVFHARRMLQLVNLEGRGASFSYSELPDQGHVFEGMMDTSFLSGFLRSQIRDAKRQKAIPSNFSVVSANPRNTHGKFGINIEELMEPTRLGRIDVRVSDGTLHLKTSNVRQLIITGELNDLAVQAVDGQDLVPSACEVSRLELIDSVWRADLSCEAMSLGGLDAFLRCTGHFSILLCDAVLEKLAVAISRNFLQYYGLDTNILLQNNTEKLLPEHGNVVTIGMGSSVPPAETGRHFPIKVNNRSVQVGIHTYKAEENADLGAVFLRPRLGRGRTGAQHLEAVVWGVDQAGVRLAMRLIPTLTGSGTPDWVIVRRAMAWNGAASVAAMGFLDGRMQIDLKGSFFGD